MKETVPSPPPRKFWPQHVPGAVVHVQLLTLRKSLPPAPPVLSGAIWGGGSQLLVLSSHVCASGTSERVHLNMRLAIVSLPPPRRGRGRGRELLPSVLLALQVLFSKWLLG